MRFLQVKNFEKHQAFRRRNPEWIKLYKSLLYDYEFSELPDAAKAHLVLIWLLASTVDNKIPSDPEWITAKIHATEPVDLERFIALGFLIEVDDEGVTREKWPSRWISEELRNQVFGRDGYQCRACSVSGAEEKLEVTFVIPITKGGQVALENLQALCRPCSRRKRAVAHLADQKIQGEKTIQAIPAKGAYSNEDHKSIHTFEQIQAYVEATKKNVVNPGGLARWLFRNGEEDGSISVWLNRQQIKSVKAQRTEEQNVYEVIQMADHWLNTPAAEREPWMEQIIEEAAALRQKYKIA